MKLDYSKKDNNWHIYTPGNDKPMKPKKTWSRQLIVLFSTLALVVVIIAVTTLASLHHHQSKSVAPIVITTPINTTTQTVTIPLELPSSTS